MIQAIKSGRDFRRASLGGPWRSRSGIQDLHLGWADALAEDWETKPEEAHCYHQHTTAAGCVSLPPGCFPLPARRAREFVACDCGEPGKRTTIIHDPIHSGEQECGFRDTHFRVREIIE